MMEYKRENNSAFHKCIGEVGRVSLKSHPGGRGGNKLENGVGGQNY